MLFEASMLGGGGGAQNISVNNFMCLEFLMHKFYSWGAWLLVC